MCRVERYEGNKLNEEEVSESEVVANIYRCLDMWETPGSMARIHCIEFSLVFLTIVASLSAD